MLAGGTSKILTRFLMIKLSSKLSFPKIYISRGQESESENILVCGASISDVSVIVDKSPDLWLHSDANHHHVTSFLC